MRVQKSDRRKVNVPVAEERRGRGVDRRKCPRCGSAVRQNVEALPGGTRTVSFCTRCAWKAESRQVDEGRLREMLGFEAEVVGTARHPVLQLTPDFVKASGFKPGTFVELKPLYTPGADAAVTWVIKKLDRAEG